VPLTLADCMCVEIGCNFSLTLAASYFFDNLPDYQA